MRRFIETGCLIIGTEMVTHMAPKKGKIITKRQIREDRFPHEYIIDLNGKKAAMRCGCPEPGAAVTATRWLKKTNVIGKIKELQAERNSKAILTADELDRRLAAMNRPTMKDFYRPDGVTPKPLNELTDEQAICIKEIGTDYLKLVDFHQTLRTGMQRLGMLKDGSDKLADTFEKWLDTVKAEKGK